MTMIVEPSRLRGVANHGNVAAIARWAGSDWIAPSGVDINGSRFGLSGTPLNGAEITTNSLDVRIDTFEAFITGAWLGSDDDTHSEHTHTLPGDSTTTTLYLGYDFSTSDTIIFGPDSEFSADDPRVKVADVTDDGTSITNVIDRRPKGPNPDVGELVDATFDANDSSHLSLDTGTIADPYPEYRVIIYRESHEDGELYQRMRLNGVTSNSYEYDLYDGFDNDFSSTNASSFAQIAGTLLGAGSSRGGGWALQHLAIKCPPEIVSNGEHYPLLDTVEIGLAENIDHIYHGHLEVDVSEVDRIDIFDGGDSTGWIAVYGVSRIV